MNCREARTFMSQIDGQQPITPISQVDLLYLSSNGYVAITSQQEHDAGVKEVENLSQMTDQVDTMKNEVADAAVNLQEDEPKTHSFLFHFEGEEKKEEMQGRVQKEQQVLTNEGPQLTTLENNLNRLIQEKSAVNRMVPYGDGYVSLTGLGTIILSDLLVRAYRVDDEDFSAFVDETAATYAELRGIADRAAWYVSMVKPTLPEIGSLADSDDSDDANELSTPSLVWSVCIGLGKLQGDQQKIATTFVEAMQGLHKFKSTVQNKVMAAEVMTALGSDLSSLEADLESLDKTLRHQGVPKELSAGVAATILAGRRYDGSFPVDRYNQTKQLTSSYEAAAILAVMNVPVEQLSSLYQDFKVAFVDWGYALSEDVEIASAYLAIGGLDVAAVSDKLKYAIAQLSSYLEYPLVAAAILTSIPVFEVHEVLDLMEKAVTLLTAYVFDAQRSEVVALAVRMIHGVRNEIVKQIDPEAPVTNTPVQFTYAPHPGFFFWYSPIIIAHSSYFSTFSGIGGFHPSHTHGIGGFAG